MIYYIIFTPNVLANADMPGALRIFTLINPTTTLLLLSSLYR